MKRLWALTGWWHGNACAILHGNYVPPFAVWMQTPEEEWNDLRKEGFYTRKQKQRPRDYVDTKDQKSVPTTFEALEATDE